MSTRHSSTRRHPPSIPTAGPHVHRLISWSLTAVVAVGLASWASFALPGGIANAPVRATGSVVAPPASAVGTEGHPLDVSAPASPVSPIDAAAPAATGEPAEWKTPGVTSDIVLLGDSIAEQSAEPLAAAVAPTPIARRYYGGTAPCDWVPVGLPASSSTMVIISFSGNSLTPCMTDGAGGHIEGDALVARYRTDVTALIDQARRLGAEVLLVGQAYVAPHFAADARVDALNALYREFAARWRHVAFVDAGRAIETADGKYADRLPCDAVDRDCAADGTTQIRSDGVHFCTVYGVVHCPEYTSGARRYADAIAEGVRSFDLHD